MDFTALLTAARDFGIPFVAATIVLFLYVLNELKELPLLRELVAEIRGLRKDLDRIMSHLNDRRY